MTDLTDKLRALRGSKEPFGPLVDEAALAVAQRMRAKLAHGVQMALTWEQWTQLAAILQVEAAMVLRHTAFDRPRFPPDDGA